jgi:hypothetical protein
MNFRREIARHRCNRLLRPLPSLLKAEGRLCYVCLWPEKENIRGEGGGREGKSTRPRLLEGDCSRRERSPLLVCEVLRLYMVYIIL